jgi:hypothetical protein
LITADGKTALRRSIASVGASIADTIVVGLGDAAGESMQCEWARFPITNVGTNPDSSQVIFKSSGNIGLIGQVREVGLLQGAGGISNDVYLSYFNTTEDSWDNTNFVTTNSRLDTGLSLDANATASTPLNNVDVSKFSQQDSLVLAGNAGGSGTVKVTLEFDNGATAQASFTVSAGYKIVSIAKYTMAKTGNVDWKPATKLTINTTTPFTADLLKFTVTDPVSEILIARKVLQTPFTTGTTLPLEIEYPLGVVLGAS